MASFYDEFNGPDHDEDPREKGYIRSDGLHASRRRHRGPSRGSARPRIRRNQSVGLPPTHNHDPPITAHIGRSLWAIKERYAELRFPSVESLRMVSSMRSARVAGRLAE